MGEKVGSDVLGSENALGQRGLTAQQRERLRKKLAEERAKQKKKDLNGLEGQEIRYEVPDHSKRPDVRDGSFDVHVRQHRRRKPKREG